MGNVTSRKASVIAEQKSPEKQIVAAIVEQSPTVDKATFALDPKTPAIPQTPLTQTIASHLNRMTTEDVTQNPNIKTPSYLLRKRILYDLGYTYPIKDTDPRSPSQCIPRTPLNLTEPAEEVNESVTSSFQYNSTLEDSCREFNTKVDDISLEDEDANAQDEQSNTDPVSDVKTDVVLEVTKKGMEKLCAQKTPDCDSEKTFDIETQVEAKLEQKNENETNENIPSEFEKSVDQNDSMVKTPVMNKSIRTGRIPLSVINRRAVTGELTPLQPKNTSGAFSVEKNRNNLSFNKYDENRGSARKSKIPVFKK